MKVRSTNNYPCNICAEDFFPSDNFSEDCIYFEVKWHKNYYNKSHINHLRESVGDFWITQTHLMQSYNIW